MPGQLYRYIYSHVLDADGKKNTAAYDLELAGHQDLLLIRLQCDILITVERKTL